MVETREKRAVAYIRVSTEQQARYGTSPETQKQEIGEYAIKNHFRIVKWFEDHVSGKEAYNRSNYNACLDYIGKSENKIEAFLVHKVDRSGRNFFEWALMQRELKKRGLLFVSTSQNITTENKQERLMANLLASFSEYEREDILEKTQKGTKALMEQGYWPRVSVHGFRKNPDSTRKKCREDIPSEPKYSILKLIFELYLTGKYTYKELIDIARVRGWRLPKATLANILKNKFYAGYVFYPAWNINVKGIHYKYRLIELEQWEYIQYMSEARKNKKTGGNPSFILARTLRCRSCGKPMAYGTSRGKGGLYPKYACHNKDCENRESYDANIVHRLYWEYVDKLTIDHEYREKIRVAVRAKFKDEDLSLTRLDDLRNDILKEEKALQILEERYLYGDIEAYMYKDLKSKIVERLQRNKKNLAAFSNNVLTLENLESSTREAIELIPTLLKRRNSTQRVQFHAHLFPLGLYTDGITLLNPRLNPLFKLYPDLVETKIQHGDEDET